MSKLAFLPENALSGEDFSAGPVLAENGPAVFAHKNKKNQERK
jgi:hypothetical protein